MDTRVLNSIASQMMSADEVEIEGKRLPVRRTSRQRLRTVTFPMGGREYCAIEQNPEKPSRWGELARSGRQVVKFKDVLSNKFVAAAVDGEVREYGKTELQLRRAVSYLEAIKDAEWAPKHQSVSYFNILFSNHPSLTPALCN